MDHLRHGPRNETLGVGVLAHPALKRRFTDLPGQSDRTMDLEHRSVVGQGRTSRRTVSSETPSLLASPEIVTVPSSASIRMISV
jgi:hypothetical protein